MTDVLLRLLLNVTLGLALALALRHPVRRAFGAGPAFALWLLPLALAAAPLLPRRLAASTVAVRLPVITITPHLGATVHGGAAFDWALLLVALWAAGAAFACGRLAWRYARLRVGVRDGSARWTAAVSGAAPGVDTRRLRMHAEGPAVLAAWPRSLLLLPADFAQRFGNAATRELVLRHELAHLHRGDAWWSLAMEAVSALLWFHPLAWLARPCFRLDQELACDAAALRSAPQHTARYARALLDSVAVQPVPALIPWLAEPQLKARIAMLARRMPGALRRRVGAAVIVVLL
ncbi:MAG TPA: M56 family metallopeptidase, partial [Rhodanobacteraceae bacterium]